MNSAAKNQQKTQKFADQLYKTLMEELSAYDYLIETLSEKQKAIVENDLQKLEHFSGVEQLIVNKANKLTEARAQILKTVQQQPGPASLVAFIRQLHPSERRPWIKINDRISRTVEKIRFLNTQNMRLLDTSLNYSRGMIELFMPNEMKSAGFYDGGGKSPDDVNTQKLLDCNA